MIPELALYVLMAATPPQAAQGSLEIMPGTAGVQGDILIKAKPAEGIFLLVRDKPKADYRGNVANFLLGRLGLNLYGGLDLALEGQAVPDSAVGRVGFTYLGKVGDLTIFLESVTNPTHFRDWENTLGIYYDRGNWEAWQETVATMDSLTPTFVGTSSRAGYRFSDRLSAGIGLETTHIREDKRYNHGFNPGLWVKGRF